MFLLRPVRENDLELLMDMLESPNYGLTSLPRDRKILDEKIQASLDAFNTRQKKPHGQSYFFVLEDVETGRITGTCAIYSKVGGFEPFYAYRVEKMQFHSPSLNIHKIVPTLHLEAIHNGPSEIGSLYLKPAFRRSGLGKFLSISRFVFMAKNRDYFENSVIAEMRGVVDETGYSPFWEALGRKFFEIDYAEADYLVNKGKKFIEELMPKFPIYIPMLPEAAQIVIGKVHPDTIPALKILEAEGFHYNNYVDIFEGGIIVSCEIDKIRTVNNIRQGKIEAILANEPQSPEYLLATDFHNLRCCKATLAERPGGISIGENTARLLKVNTGDEVCYIGL